MVSLPIIRFHLNQNVDQIDLTRAVNKTEWMDLEMNISGYFQFSALIIMFSVSSVNIDWTECTFIMNDLLVQGKVLALIEKM